MRIAVDVLGGDHAPGEILAGVAAALRGDFTADELLLVGPEDVVEQQLRKHGVGDLPEVLHTTEVVEGHESPIVALRRKPKASVALCMHAVREGKADGLVSFGNTGATVAACTMGLGMLSGIRRPAITVDLRGAGSKFVLLDAGANPSPKPLHLYQYGLMGAAYTTDMHGIAEPRVGLLNIGGEAGKGDSVTKEAYRLLAESNLNFIGNLEGQEIFHGKADVLLTDGFVGNMLIKVFEGFTEFLFKGLGSLGSERGDLMEGFRSIFGVAEYSDIGGAVLLGVDGVVLIGHGRSEARAVPSALREARRDVEAGVNRHITETLYSNPGAIRASGTGEVQP
ncbi:MAG TPA: phosphate acyltransferase PlsX [Planctomycetota bacterium]